MFRRLCIFSLLLALIGSAIACQITTPPTSYGNDLNWGGEVDPRFREFYEQKGGVDVLSYPISPKFINNGLEFQYTATVLMVYDPMALPHQQFYFAPIGLEMSIKEPPTDPNVPGGHAVYPGFEAMIGRLGGVEIIGDPLTPVHYNEEREAIEQFFENVGLFQFEAEASDQVRLVYYGAWMCAEVCEGDLDPIFMPMLTTVIATPFIDAVSRLEPTFIGKPLTEPYHATDGQLEQIFENVVIVADPDRPGGIAFRPITAMLGVQTDPDVQFEIPEFFLEYLRQNSGLEMSGPAVTEFTERSEEMYRQCFTNLCLDYFPNKPVGLRVRMTPLGYIYQKRFYEEVADSKPTPDSSQMLTMKVSKGYGFVSPGDSQIIIVTVFQNYQPSLGVAPNLTVMMPGGEIKPYSLPPTQTDGRTSVELEPITAPRGTRVDYRVCIDPTDGQEFCIDDYFFIWGNE